MVTDLPDGQARSDTGLARATADDQPTFAAIPDRHADHKPGRSQALSPRPRHRHPSILAAAAFAALIAEVGITVSGPGVPGTAPGGTTATSTAWSTSFSLVDTGWWTPDSTAPPATEATAEPQTAPPQTAAPHTAAPPTAAPPPAPPSELAVRYDNSSMAVFVSITNNANKPAVGCTYRSVAVAGEATIIHYDHTDNFTVTGSAETRIEYHGPATGSTFHNVVTCDNGLSNTQDVLY